MKKKTVRPTLYLSPLRPRDWRKRIEEKNNTVVNLDEVVFTILRKTKNGGEITERFNAGDLDTAIQEATEISHQKEYVFFPDWYKELKTRDFLGVPLYKKDFHAGVSKTQQKRRRELWNSECSLHS